MSTITFPFQRGETYKFRELRAFEKCLSNARQTDAELSKKWRVPDAPEMKQASKIREETYPLMMLSDKMGFPDEGTFCLTPDGFPNIDAEIRTGAEAFMLQITIADPVWEPGRNGGYDFRLSMEALNRDGVVHGLTSMRREGGKIVSAKPVRSLSEEFDACVLGLENAIRRKIKRGSPGLRLLVDARGYCKHVIDFPLETVVGKAFSSIGQHEVDAAFEAYYFVDEGPNVFLKYPQ